MIKIKFKKVLLIFLALLMPGPVLFAQTDQWQPVSGAETLRNFVSGLTVERELPNGEISRGEYRADGTGTLYSWGASLSRTWSIKGDEQICITEIAETLCYTFEKNTVEPGLYRAREVVSGTLSVFRAGNGRAAGNGAGLPHPKTSVMKAVLPSLLPTKSPQSFPIPTLLSRH